VDEGNKKKHNGAIESAGAVFPMEPRIPADDALELEATVAYQLKRISTAGIPEAVSKAELYRSLNEPEEAESICRDILAIEPDHQLALRLLGLALTDQFTGGGSDRYRETERIFEQLEDPYEQLYYTGILYERRAKAQLNAGTPHASARTLFEEALRLFADAERIRPSENDDAILRWNRCVRLLQTPAYQWEEPEYVSFDAQDAPPR
jgi:tetratricopeptide (TPR) repeat protein